MKLNIILSAVGLILLIKGADWLGTGASIIARKQQIPDLPIGLTIVAFGTSAPELVVNIAASLENRQDLVFSTIIGSNNFNLFLILGVAGLITPLVVVRPILYDKVFNRDIYLFLKGYGNPIFTSLFWKEEIAQAPQQQCCRLHL